MPDFTVHPQPSTTISSSEVAEHLKKFLATKDRVHEGYGLVTSAASLTATIQKGRAYINGYEVGDGSDDADVAKLLTANQTNHIYLKVDGNIEVNTTGVQPANSIELWRATTDGTGVTGTTDKRVFDVDVVANFLADKITSRSSVGGTSGDLAGTQPYLRLSDSSGGGGVTRRLWARSGKLQLTDDAGSTVYIDDLSTIFGTLVQGGVLFATSTTAVGVDGANFFWDDTNNRLGLGTNTPHFPLDIAGHIRLRATGRLYFRGTGAADNDVELYGSDANTLETPDAFKALSFNGLTITATTGGVLSISNNKTLAAAASLTLAGTDGKTLTVSNTLTLAGTDGSTLNIGGGGTLGSAAFTASSAYQPADATLTNLSGKALTGSGDIVLGTSPTIATPVITTNAQVPLIIGGSAATSGLSLQSTSGVGTTDFIRFLVGNNGATEAARFLNAGHLQMNGHTIIGGTGVGGALILQSTSAVGTTDHIKFLVGNNGATEAARFNSTGAFGLGATAGADRRLAVAVRTGLTGTTGTRGINTTFEAGTSTFTGAQTGTIYIVDHGIVTLAGDTLQTIPTAATVHITGAPAAGANTTITTPLALWVDDGVSRFDGDIHAQSKLGIGESLTTTDQGILYAQTSATTAIAKFQYSATDASGPQFLLRKTRGTVAAKLVVAADDQLGELAFQGFDGSSSATAASIRGYVDGTPGASDVPGRLSFWTTADGANSPTERMRITNSGNVGIGATTVNVSLQLGDGGTNKRFGIGTTGGNARLEQGLFFVGNVTTSAQTIYTSPQLGGNSNGALLMVVGRKSTDGATMFADLIWHIDNNQHIVVAQVARGSPASRSYTSSGNALNLTMGADTYQVQCAGMLGASGA